MAFKKILDEKKISQQDMIERLRKEFVISNVMLLFKEGKDK